MHFSLLSAIVFPVAAFASAQVNFYYDTACQNYAGTSYAELGGDSVGGPAGSSSMLFVNSDSCSDTCGPNLYFCKNSACEGSASYDLASNFGQCKHFANGVWAKEDCGCL